MARVCAYQPPVGSASFGYTAVDLLQSAFEVKLALSR